VGPIAEEDPRWRPRLTAPAGLVSRYGLPAEREAEAWSLLYQREPELYDLLVEGEPLHPRLFRELPLDGAQVLEVGAGTGRLTLPAAARAAQVYALEPVAAMRRVLRQKLEDRGVSNVILLEGRAEAVPLPDHSVDLAVSASAFGADPEHGGEAGLRELLRVTRRPGQVIVLWPDDPVWFSAHGFTHLAFEGELDVRFRDLATARLCAGIFYAPAVLAHFERARRPVIPFAALGVNVARDLCRLAVR
jgi:SAM-dependent methyltransferase